ncbi:ABC transporter permease [Halovenus salina]|uniref:ABC transporter permease n=1 Tax=Halovenus salina TaxID=1510225 RepID=UPI002260FDCB|nr:ABC transporter permease [Halovenus salina]
MLVVVTGLALGLAGTTTVAGDDVNYWVVPSDSDIGSTPFAYEGARLSGVHEKATMLSADNRIDHATAVAFELLRLENNQADEAAYVLALGVMPNSDSVAGIDITPLDERYPYYTDREWTGELIASPATETLLGIDEGETLGADGTDRRFTVVSIAEDNPQLGTGEIPLVVVPLAELQSVTTLADSDAGDQILVATDDRSVRDDLEATFPEATITTRSGLSTLNPAPTSLPFAMAVAAGLAALGIGVMFVTTMMGLELTATRQQTAVLSAIGLRYSSLALVVITETLTLAVLGGAVGILVGFAGIFGLNAGIGSLIGLPTAATISPLLAVYGLVVAIGVGLLSVGYPLYLTKRTGTLEELNQ